MQDAAPPLAAGRYRLVRRLGQGGMATVYAAWDGALGAWRAVKLLDPRLGAGARRRFDNEARAMARLRHPNVLTVHDVGTEADGRPYLVMELAPGGSLADLLARVGPIPPRVAVDLVRGALAGLQAAHDAGIVHRDVKPQNVLLAADGTPLVADFGIARIDTADLTRTGAAIGTLAYMAPEQRSSAKEADPRADVYAAGGTLYALLTGREPLDLYVSEDWRGVPDALVPILRRATAWERDARHPSARALAEDLGAVHLPEVGFAFPPADSSTLDPPDTDSETFDTGSALDEPAPPMPRRRPWGLLALPLAAAALLLWPRAPAPWQATRLDVPEVGLFGLAFGGGALHYVSGGRMTRDPLDGGPEDLGPWDGATFDVAPDGTILMTDWYAPSPVRRWDRGSARELGAVGQHAKAAPDGERVASLVSGELVVSGMDGAAPRVVGKLGRSTIVYDLGWSADGRWLTTASRLGALALQLWPVDGGSAVTVVEDARMLSPLRTTAAAWMGDRLWYARGDARGSAIVEVPVGTSGQPEGEPREVARFDAGFPIFLAADGERAAALVAVRRRSVFVGEGALDLPGRDAARFLEDGTIVGAGPDGVFVGDERISDSPGGRLVIAGDAALVERPTPWGTEREWFRVPLAGGPEVPFAPLDPNAALDCRDATCVLASPWGVVFQLLRFDPETGAVGERIANVSVARDEHVQLAVAPGGGRVALFELGPEIVLVDLADGATRRVPTTLAFAQFGAFTPDGREVVALGRDASGWAVARVPLDGGAVTVTPATVDAFGGVDVAPDGRVLTVRTRYENTIWTITR